MLVWMYHRCEGKNHRNNKLVLNGFGMEALQRMVRKCYNGLSERGRLNAVDNVAMTDVSKDEESPEHGMTENDVQIEILQSCQAENVGLDLVRRTREVDQAAEGTKKIWERVVWVRRFARAISAIPPDPVGRGFKSRTSMEIHHDESEVEVRKMKTMKLALK